MEMKQLPEARIYEEGLRFWPYKNSLATVLQKLTKVAPQNGTLLDVMCGPGYLLGEIAKKRPDLKLAGMDIDDRYITYGRQMYPGVEFEQGDVLTWQPKEKYDVVICTGSVHHIPYEQQEVAIKNIGAMAKTGGVVIISDCFVDDYSNEWERKQSAAKLGYEYLKATIANEASDAVISWTIDLIYNDVFMKEFKPSPQKRLPIYDKYFENIETIKSWPKIESGYGDYISVLKPKAL